MPEFAIFWYFPIISIFKGKPLTIICLKSVLIKKNHRTKFQNRRLLFLKPTKPNQTKRITSNSSWSGREKNPQNNNPVFYWVYYYFTCEIENEGKCLWVIRSTGKDLGPNVSFIRA